MSRTEDILHREVTYLGEGISLRTLEDTISEERTRQDTQLRQLASLRERNADLQGALKEEMRRLRDISEQMARQREQGGVRSWLSWLPWIRNDAPTATSIEDLLRRQYELSALRLKEAAEFADRLEAAKSDLFDEIDRLNQKIIDAAKNEEIATAYVSDLRELKERLEQQVLEIEPGSASERETQRDLDLCRRRLAEHTTRLKLYASADERLAKLRRNTRQLAETIANLQSDITRYVTAASEKMDLVSGQIQAIGAAADASVVMLELKESLDAMTDSVNYTTRFVAETQQYFRNNVDRMIDELQLYDAETEKVLQENHMRNEILDEIELERSLSSSLAQRIDRLAEEVELDLAPAEHIAVAKK